MKAFSLLATALLFCFTASTSAAVQSGLIVSHHEEFREFSLRNTALNAQSAPGQASRVTSSRVLSFNALGRSYDLQLVDNSRLLTNEARQSLTGNIQIYRGQVAGAADSWVRITIIDGMPVGMIWDGEQMIAIEGPARSCQNQNPQPIQFLHCWGRNKPYKIHEHHPA